MLVLQHMIRWIVPLAAVGAALGQAPAVDPRFDVSSVKRCESNARSGGIRITPGTFSAVCLTVKFLMQVAYAPSPDASVPISGGSAWIDSDPYNIQAKAESNPSRQTMSGPMLQALLAERFKLRVHRESKEVPVYELRIAKNGSKLQAFQEGSCTPPDAAKPGRPAKGPPDCGSFSIGLKGANVSLDVHKRTLAEFANQLHLDRPVIDKTGLAGLFDFHLEFSPDGTTAGFFPPGFALPALPDAGVSIFTAIQEQLGLRLEPARGPGETIVIDSVERPSED